MRAQVFAQLQAIDQQLAHFVVARRALLAELESGNDLAQQQATIHDRRSQLRAARAENSDLQWELDELERHIRWLDDTERDGPGDPLVARELTVLRQRHAQLESRILEQYEAIAAGETALAALEAQLAEATAAWQRHEAHLQRQLEQTGAYLETQQAARARLAERIPARLLQQYDDLQRRHRGTAIAPIRHRQCGICRARLPDAVFDLLAIGETLVRCPRCGRVLVVPDANSPAG